MSEIPRSEYPRPQFVREPWVNLNGTWTFAFDFGKSGTQRGFANSKGFDQAILVPFCPESKLSGVGHTDFIEAMWYHRKLSIPADWNGKRIVLHFGGVDYFSEVYIDGRSVGRHWGGSASFQHDITPYVKPGQTHDLVVHVEDDVRSGKQPGGKQCPDYKSRGCHYTRTTGIWQTVWMEAVSPEGLRRCTIVPDVDWGRFVVTPTFYSVRPGYTFKATVYDGGEKVAEAVGPAVDALSVALSIESPKLWGPGHPFLYDLRFEVLDQAGNAVDVVQSYAGLRKIHIEGDQVYLNNEPIYQRLVLDQGFYPDGIWTAPSDEALRRDIELSMQAGFNGARLHQKVFEERFHYWADRLGYLTWGESASWGMDVNDPVSARNFLSEWQEVVIRDRNHPSIIAWSPFNETRDVRSARQHNRVHIDAYELTKALDPTRPVNDASGYVHVRTDLWTVHNYTQDPQKLKEILTPTEDGVFRNHPNHEAEYAGQPYIVDEFGGIKWVPPQRGEYADNSWGYGDTPRTIEEFYARLEGQVEVLLGFDHVRGYCYTQLTDVEQEENGIYNYDRSPKFDMERIRAIFSREPKQGASAAS